MKSKKGFQLSINMLVVIILGLVILGIGVSIFFNAYGEVAELRSDVDQQTASRINSLLDDGSLIVIPFSSKDGKRGDYVDFDMGINNELGNTYSFSVLITYAGSSANPQPSNLFPVGMDMIKNFANSGNLVDICPDINNPDGPTCGTSWVLMLDEPHPILNDERELIPIRIVIPKKNIPKGQYIFNVDVCYNVSTYDSKCVVEGNKIANRFASREKLYITI